MNKGQLTTRCRNLLNETSTTNTQFTDAMLLDAMNDGYLLAAAKSGLNQSIATASSVLGQALYALPADVLRIQTVKYSDPTLSTAVLLPLTYMTLLQLGARYNNWENDPNGLTLVYYRPKRTVLGLYPKPVAAGTSNIKIYYTERPTKLAAASDIPDLPEEHHILLPYYAAFQMLMMARDPAAGGFKTLFDQGLNQMEIEQSTWSEEELSMGWEGSGSGGTWSSRW